jgi:hypothetical protein
VNPLPADVSDLIRACFISPSDPIDLGDFCIPRSIERSNHTLIPRSTEQMKSEDSSCSLNGGQAARFSKRDVIAASTVDLLGVPTFLFPSTD